MGYFTIEGNLKTVQKTNANSGQEDISYIMPKYDGFVHFMHK